MSTETKQDHLEGTEVGPRKIEGAEVLEPTTVEALRAKGLEVVVPAGHTAAADDHPHVQEMKGLPNQNGRIVKVRGQWGGFGVQGVGARKFKVMATDEGANNQNPDLIGKIIEVTFTAFMQWAMEQIKQRSITITDLVMKQRGDGFDLVDFKSEYAMDVEMHTEWDDTLVVWVGQTPYQFRPGEGQTMKRRTMVKGPDATQTGMVAVSMYNTAGKAIEIIGNWSIDVSFKVLMGGKVTGEARRNGWEGRGARFDYGPYPFGLQK